MKQLDVLGFETSVFRIVGGILGFQTRRSKTLGFGSTFFQILGIETTARGSGCHLQDNESDSKFDKSKRIRKETEAKGIKGNGCSEHQP